MSLILPIFAALMLVFVNGWTDAPNAITCPIVTSCLTKKQALTLAGIMNMIGCVGASALGGRVAEATKNIIPMRGPDGIRVLTVGMAAVVMWSVAAWCFGIPTSESHGMYAALSGAAMGFAASRGMPIVSSVGRSTWILILLGLVLSTLPAVALGGLFLAFTNSLERKIKRRGRAIGEGLYRKAQIAGAVATSLMHGAEDGQKFVGILFLILSSAGILSNNVEERGTAWISLAVALIMTLGTICGGGRIVERTGRDMVLLDKKSGFCADMGASAVLLICLAVGIPVSTTHAKTCAMMGAGRGASRRVISELLLAWALTFPICFLIGAIGGYFVGIM